MARCPCYVFQAPSSGGGSSPRTPSPATATRSPAHHRPAGAGEPLVEPERTAPWGEASRVATTGWPGNLSPNPTAHPVGTERYFVVNDTRAGRHRPATPYNPVTELSTILRSAGETSVKASAVLAASGGMVATFSLPAQANPSEVAAATGVTASSAASAAPAEPATLSLAPAIVAPEPASPVASEAIGVAGLKAVAKPKPAPAPRPAPVEEAVAERTSTSSTPTA